MLVCFLCASDLVKSSFLSGISPYLLLLYTLYLLVAQTTTSCQASSLLCFWQRCLFHIYGLSAEMHPLDSAVPAFWVWIFLWDRALGSAVPSVSSWKRAFLGPNFWHLFSHWNCLFYSKNAPAPQIRTGFNKAKKADFKKPTLQENPPAHIYIYIHIAIYIYTHLYLYTHIYAGTL